LYVIEVGNIRNLGPRSITVQPKSAETKKKTSVSKTLQLQSV